MQITTNVPLQNQHSLSKKLLIPSEHFLIVAALIALLSISVADSDLWGHLRFGLDFLRDGTLARIDPYSYQTAGSQWINHEWLAEVLFAEAWTVGGIWGLTIFKLVIGFLIALPAYWHLSHYASGPLQAGSVLPVVIFLLLPSIGTIRPQLFTVLLFSLVIQILLQAQAYHYRWLWLLPVIFMFWANLHGGFLAGLGIVGLWSFLHLIFNRAAWKQVIFPFITSILATLINPYGISLLIFLIKTATIPRPEITEWQPLPLLNLLGMVYLLSLAVCIVGLIFSTRKRDPVFLILIGFLAMMPLIAMRHLPFFAIGSVYFAAPHLLDWLNQRKRMAPAKPFIIPATVIVSLIGSGIFLYLGISRLGIIPVITKQYPFPVSAVSLLKQSGVSGNLAVDFGWGEYVIWHLGDRVKVSMDGRRETIYSPEIYSEYENFEHGINEWDAVLRSTDLVLVQRFSPPYNLLLLKPSWNLIYEDADSALFSSHNFPYIQGLKRESQSFRPPAPPYTFP